MSHLDTGGFSECCYDKDDKAEGEDEAAGSTQAKQRDFQAPTAPRRGEWP